MTICQGLKPSPQALTLASAHTSLGEVAADEKLEGIETSSVEVYNEHIETPESFKIDYAIDITTETVEEVSVDGEEVEQSVGSKALKKIGKKIKKGKKGIYRSEASPSAPEPEPAF